MKTLRSKTYPGVTWVPKAEALAHQLADLKRRASTARTAALRQASSRPEVPPPPSLAKRLREASGRPAETIEERMQRDADRAHEHFRVTPLEASKAGVPKPPSLGRYIQAINAGASCGEAMRLAREAGR